MSDGKRTSRKAPYRTSVIIILLCGLVAAAAMYIDGRRREDERAEADFVRRAEVRHALTREVLQRYTETMFGLSTMFALDRDISRAEFARATSQLQPRLSGALAFEWAPYVSREQRPAVEHALQQVYAPLPFQFVDFDAEGRIRRAADRPFFVPLCLVEPLRGNEIVLGYDLMTAPTRPYIERAWQTRQMTVSNQFRLRQETGNELGVIIILPVFRPAKAAGATGADPNTPAGFLQCVFHVREFLREACARQPDPMLDMLFVDASETNSEHRVLYYQPSATTVPSSPTPDEAGFRRTAPFVDELRLPMGERDWRVIYRPHAGWLESQHTLAPFWRAMTLLSLACLLAGFVRVIGRRTETIRREVEQRTAELAESRRQFANFVHSLPGMAFRARYKDHLEVVFASEGTLALTGCPPDEFTSGAIHVREFIHPDDLDRVRTETRAALAAHKDAESIYRMRARDGSERWVLSRCRGVYAPDGSVQFIEGIVIDITDQKRAEEARLALERKLLEAQKYESLGLLAGGIAHDFNNLLSAILGNASLARLNVEGGSSSDPQLRAIETAALRAAELCRQMLAYAGKGKFVVERVDLTAIVEDLLPLLRVSIARTAELHLELSRELAGVKADATQVRQIVMNLVLNAVDALAGRNGKITIRTGLAEVDRALLATCITGQSLPLGSYVYLEVADTGCGMTPEVMAKIFDPFFTTKFAGRGLGLAAVLGIIRGHNGALQVESEVDRGSRFRLYLPAIMGEVVRLDEPAPAAPERWRQTGDVLLIEDEEPVRIVVKALLQTFGFDVVDVADGRTGLDAFRKRTKPWSLVIIDLVMPGMTGEETLTAIQELQPGVRILLVSGHAEPELLRRIRTNGQLAFLAKPFKREAFEAKLKELFAPE